ncbi:hypothetical protein NFC81_06995 [Salinispirillum sp. LH 10-3-1]|uniref:DUF3108 domain-containing protein n=1 Tax=Salinispirillum sp. LH 10-3-1 TaxID=2952525 RepID=A0AB38YKD1_9GAMM
MKLISIGLLGLLLSTGSTAANWDLMGTARDPETGSLIYREFHRVNINSDNSKTRVVEYRDEDDELMVIKTLVTPEGRPYLPELEWDDRIQSSTIIGRFNEGIYQQRIDRPDGNTVERAQLSDLQNTVLDAGFDQYLQDRMTDIIDNGRIDFDFLSLGAGRTYAFTAQLQSLNDNTIEVRVAPRSAIIRFFVDPIDLVYDRETLALQRYQGITNFRRDGSIVNAIIEYEYLTNNSTEG